MTERASLSVCCSGPSFVVLVSGVVDALALSRVQMSGLHSGGVKVQFLSEADRRAIVQLPVEQSAAKKNERLRAGNSQPFGVPTGS